MYADSKMLESQSASDFVSLLRVFRHPGDVTGIMLLCVNAKVNHRKQGGS